MAESKAIKSGKNCQEEKHAQSAKPPGLPICRSNHEVQCRALLVPHSVVIARDYTKTIFPGTQVRIKSFTTSARVLPIAIMPVKSVAKPHLLGNEKTRRCVPNLEIASQRRKLKTFLWFILLSVSNNTLDVDRRNRPVTSETGRVDHLKNHIVYKPQPTVGRFRGRIERPGTW